MIADELIMIHQVPVQAAVQVSVNACTGTGIHGRG
jgi:hypothetical protein